MIRRDYILRMIEEFIAVLSRLSSLKQDQHWREASGVVNEEVQKLLGIDSNSAVQLTETELLARLIKGEPTQVVREKTLIVATLFKEAGDLALAENRLDQGRALHLKGLHLLLDVLAQDEPFECPGFVPRVEGFIAALQDSVLPLPTLARLMQHYERLGEFAKAEDCLFGMLESQPDNPRLVEFGVAFYQRLASHSDSALLAGNLPRPELEAGLGELRKKVA
ncbi:MAG TPA: DUF6483 family protein [Candidatus Limnocylindrales bacterium]|nr:DUF6483 family protein [Candidatus Limnocylindrales bacterium]